MLKIILAVAATALTCGLLGFHIDVGTLRDPLYFMGPCEEHDDSPAAVH